MPSKFTIEVSRATGDIVGAWRIRKEVFKDLDRLTKYHRAWFELDGDLK